MLKSLPQRRASAALAWRGLSEPTGSPQPPRAPTIDHHDHGVIGDIDQIDTLIDQVDMMQILDAWNTGLLHD